MVPPKDLNIYPKNDENLTALLSYYFDKYDVNQEKGVEMLKKRTSLSLNQVEFIIKKLSEAYSPIFKKHLKGEIIISTLIQYGFDALTGTEVYGSKNGKLITKEFAEFVSQTESANN